MRRGYIRRNARVDNNAKAIVDGLNALPGVKAVAIGQPLDLLVGYCGINFVIEVKNRDGKDKRGPSWEKQLTFMQEWPGRCAVVHDLDEAVKAIGYIHRG